MPGHFLTRSNILILCLISLLMFNVPESTGRTIQKTYQFSDPQIRSAKGYSEVSFSGTTLFGEPGKPVLPFYPVMLMLPPGEIADEIEYEFLDPVILPGNYQLRPGQAYRPLSYTGTSEFLKDDDTYASNQPFPASLVHKVNTHFMNGYGFAVSNFTPVSYVPSEGKVVYYQNVIVKIHTVSHPRAIIALQNLRSSGKILENISSIAQNPGLISAYSSHSGRSGGGQYQYLMITSDTYAPELDTLIGFYAGRGLTAMCFTLSHIDTAAAGMDMQEKIRNFIIEEYQENGVEYVLLAGDIDIIPYRGFYCYVVSGPGYSSSNIPSDLYFSALDGTWNDDNDDWWGEPGEDDLLPDVAVGRLTFSDTAELHNMIHKVIMYQQSPVTQDLEQPLLVGEHLWDDPETWGSDYLRLLVGYHNDNGYTTTGIPPFHDIDSLFDEYGYCPKQLIIDSINNGHSFVHHVGHANSSYVMKLTTSDITNSNFSQVNGISHNYPVIYTHGCTCGAFDVSDCIAEKMIGIDNFAVAFIGNSRYGWFVEGTTDGPSQHLHREFLDAIYSDSLYRIGMAHMRSKAETASFVDLPDEYEPGAHRWCFYDCNMLGDPMMALWTEVPHSIAANHPPLIMVGSDTVLVNVTFNGTGQKNMVCGLFQSGELLGSAETDLNGHCQIGLHQAPVQGEATLIVSGFNVLPHSFTIGVAPYWIGITSDWNDPQNWSSNQVPGPNTNIIIPEDPPGQHFPTVNTGGPRHCREIYIEQNASLHLDENDTLIIHNN